MKSTMLLATALFLAIAPGPDGNDIAEMTAGFIVPEMASGSLSPNEARPGDEALDERLTFNEVQVETDLADPVG
ncbi:MAG: hypothetical protein GWM87_01945 [Xanthomonadales bacterium]|nr:hypothetical protein [Xanthomonadales bacterium]NIX11841.1 hypothetical protein [Xanthomonadales bacterium]